MIRPSLLFLVLIPVQGLASSLSGDAISVTGSSASGPSAATRVVASALEDDAIDVSLLELANVEWKKGKKLPKEVRDLKGEVVKLVGYMALDTEEGQTTFRMSYESCSCSTSKVTHFVKVTLPEDEVTTFEPGTIEVIGKFYAGARYDDDGFVDSVFRVRAKSITAQ